MMQHVDQVTVQWRSFQLDPDFPVGTTQPEYEMLAAEVREAQRRGIRGVPHFWSAITGSCPVRSSATSCLPF